MKKLYELISSLSQAEKKHVKVRLTSNKDSSLLIDFYNILSKQKAYNLNELIEQSGKSLKLVQSSLSLLYEIILKDLRYLREDDNIEIKLRNNLIDIKTLVFKGFLDEAETRCLKVISKARINEEYATLINAYEELWEIHLKRGNLNALELKDVQIELEECFHKANTLFKLKNWYRIVAEHYYNYFFYSTCNRITEQVSYIFENVNQLHIDTDKSKFIYLEIKAVESILKSDINQHHEIRKEQFLLSLSAIDRESNKISILLILSHLCTKLKIDRKINELKAYMDLLQNPFFDFSESQKNYVLMEKYYDIYFTNKIYSQIFLPNCKAAKEMHDYFCDVKNKKLITNDLLLSRIHCAFIELEIFEENYIEALHQLELYYEHFKKYKKSIQYFEALIFEATTICLLNSFDIFLDKLERINRKLKLYKIDLPHDFQIMIEFLNLYANSNISEAKQQILLIKNKQTYRLVMYKLTDKLSIQEIRQMYLQINDENYNASNDKFLIQAYKLMNNREPLN